MNANINGRNNNVARIANNNVVTTHSSEKEQTAMNTIVKSVKSVAARAAKTLGALALLSLATLATAKADVSVVGWVQPSHNTMVTPAPNSTVLQIEIYNNANYIASGVQANVTFGLPFLAGSLPGSQTTVTSDPVTLGANQSKWVNVMIPNKLANGLSYYNNTLNASIAVDNKKYPISFLDVAPSASLQFGNVTAPVATTVNNQTRWTFTITINNTGYAAANNQILKVNLTPYDEGSVGNTQPLTQTVNIPAQGQTTVQFTLPSQAWWNANTSVTEIQVGILIGSVTLDTTYFNDPYSD